MKRISLITLVVSLSIFIVAAEAYATRNCSPKPSHDVAITNMSAPSSCVQGDTLTVMVTVENQGNCSESSDITLTDSTDNFPVGSQSVTLSSNGQGGIDEVVDVIFDAETTGVQQSGHYQQFGHHPVTGDVNGDGYDDLLLSCALWNKYQGRAYLYLGGKDMIDPKKPHVVFIGEHIGDWFSLGCDMGDINGDGYDDVLIGSLGYNNLHSEIDRDNHVNIDGQGRAYLFYGSPNMDADVDVIFDGEPGGSGGFGREIDIGYIDGDKYADILVNANYYDSEKGRAYLFYGGDPIDITADKIFDGEHPYDRMGREQDIGEDVNGDGYGDIVFGARAHGRHRGRVYLFYGGPKETMDTVCDKTFTGESVGDEFGSSVCICDIDRDNFADVIIGARKYKRLEGRMYLYWGGPDINVTTPDLEFEGTPGTSMGGDTIDCGYFNNDEYVDIVVGAYDYPNFTQQGRSSIYYGNTKSLMDTTPEHYFTGDVPGTMYSVKLVSGDFNGDGYDDLVCGAPWYPSYDTRIGRAYLYYNNPPSSTDLLFRWDTTSGSLGKHILKVEIDPVVGEEDTADNSKTKTVNVKSKVKEK